MRNVGFQQTARALAAALPARAETPGERDLFWELATDLFTILEPDGTVQSVNPAWRRVLGWAWADVVGRDVFELVHPDDVAAARAAALSARDDERRVTRFESRLRRANGEHVPFTWSAYSDGKRWYLVGTDATEQQAAREELEAALHFNRSTLDLLEAGVAVLDRDGRTVAANCAWALGDPLTEPTVAAGLRSLLDGRAQRFHHAYGGGADGEERFFDLHAVRTEDAGSARVVVQRHDVTERVRSERALHLTGGLLDQVSAAVIATDLDGAIVSWNEGAEAMYGWSAADALGRDIVGTTVPPGLRDHRWAAMATLLADGRFESEHEMIRADGSTFIGSLRCTVYADAGGVPAGLIGVCFDISDKVQDERELRAARDHLRAVTDSMGEGLLTLDTGGCVTYVNAAAERLLGWRPEELIGRPMHETISRASGDGSMAGTPHDLFFHHDGSQVPVSYVSAPLLGSADRGGTVVVFSDITDQLAEQRRLHAQIAELRMLDTIRRALEEDRFVLHGQPILDLATGEVAYHEMLLRMVDRRGRLVAPGTFLPVAEQHGVVIDIDHWVLRRALAIAARGCPVSINLSAHSFADPGLTCRFATALKESGADPSDVLIELTETALIENDQAAAHFVETARTLGVRIALDDFGTGYGSFSYLKHLELHCLKIDMEFVSDIAVNPASRCVAEAVVGLAKGFNLKTVAEGVEDLETIALLAALGVDYVQGHALGGPGPL